MCSVSIKTKSRPSFATVSGQRGEGETTKVPLTLRQARTAERSWVAFIGQRHGWKKPGLHVAAGLVYLT